MSSAISQILGIQTMSVVMFTTESSQPSLHQLTTPPKIQILNLTVSVIKIILVSINSVTFNIDACKASFLNYFLILKKGP